MARRAGASAPAARPAASEARAARGSRAALGARASSARAVRGAGRARPRSSSVESRAAPGLGSAASAASGGGGSRASAASSAAIWLAQRAARDRGSRGPPRRTCRARARCAPPPLPPAASRPRSPCSRSRRRSSASSRTLGTPVAGRERAALHRRPDTAGELSTERDPPHGRRLDEPPGMGTSHCTLWCHIAGAIL